MRSISILRWTLAASFLLSPVLALTQVTHSASDSSTPLALGGGISGFDPDLLRAAGGDLYWKNRGSGIMLGVSAWGDYYPRRIPHLLNGLGVAAQVREVAWRRSVNETDFRTRTVGGGAIYSWRHFANFRPYGKAGVSYGWIDFAPKSSSYHSDTRTVPYFGGGLEYRVWRHVWARADYEYQMWPDLLFGKGSHIEPEGVTLGATYRFGRIRTR